MPTTHNNFRIFIDHSLNVCQLAEIARTTPITRTNHIGNLNPAELAVLTLGVPFRMVDKNYSVIDDIYRPEAQIINEELTIQSQQKRVLVPFLQDKSSHALAQMHVAAIRKAVPGRRVSTYSLDYLAEIDQVLPVLETMASISPQMFNRVTSEDGTTMPQFAIDDDFAYFGTPDSNVVRVARKSLATRTIRYFEQAAASVENGKPATGSGYVLLKADADIILQGVIDTASESSLGLRRFYQCSGSPMTRYIADPRMDKQGTINRIYAKLQQRLKRLPCVEMILLPISHLRFAYGNATSLRLHEKINQIETELQLLKKAKGEEIKRAHCKKHREQVIEKYQLLFMRVKSRKKGYIDELLNRKFSPFYTLKSPHRMTQYDLAGPGRVIKIPDDVMVMSLKSLSARSKKLLADHPEKRAVIFN